MIDMTELMYDPDFIQPQQVQVLRTQGAYNGHGLWLNTGPRQELLLTMVIQQGVPKTLLALAEGERDQDYITCWSHDELIVADGTTPQESDVIFWRGRPYRIIRCADRSDNGFWEAIAQWSPNTGGTDQS